MKKILYLLLIAVTLLISADLVVRDTNILDENNNAISVKASDNGDGTYNIGPKITEGALDVHVKEIHTNMINAVMHFETAIATTFANPVSAQDRTFDVVDATGFAIGDRIQIEDGLVETQYPSILNLVGNTVTLNRPIDKDYTTADGIRKIEINMAVNGSVTPVSFKVVGETTAVDVHITRLLFNMVHATAGDMGKFGNLAPLTRGVLVRAFYKRTNEYKTVALWKTNSDIAIDMYDVRFDSRAGGAGDFGTSGRWTLTAAGIAAELQSGLPFDFIEILIQDDLTGLTTFTINAQGHTED
jgi:hypothetical protein